MNIQGWELHPETLPHWDNRDIFPSCEDHLFESPDGDTATLIYSVIEARMLDYRGFCAVYRDKQSPKLLLSIRYVNFVPFAHYSKDGNVIFLKASYRGGKRFLLVLDLKKEAYAVIHFSPPCLGYGIREGDNRVFTVCFTDDQLRADERLAELDGTKIDSRELKWRKWTALAEGEDLNLQGRGLKCLFESKEKIWRESLKQVRLGCISAQEFVDVNRNKVLYWCSPFRMDAYGHVRIFALENPDMDGRYLPVFSSREACIDYLECRGEGKLSQGIRRSRLKDVMKFLDSGPTTRDCGVVVDPHEAFVAIPPGVRVTPNSLRY